MKELKVKMKGKGNYITEKKKKPSPAVLIRNKIKLLKRKDE